MIGTILAVAAVGCVFQRPEMHRIHHQYARHRNNYGDIVWWDMLFGTHENPRDFALQPPTIREPSPCTLPPSTC